MGFSHCRGHKEPGLTFTLSTATVGGVPDSQLQEDGYTIMTIDTDKEAGLLYYKSHEAWLEQQQEEHSKGFVFNFEIFTLEIRI